MYTKNYSILDFCSCDIKTDIEDNISYYTFYYKVKDVIIDVREFANISKGLLYQKRLDRKLKKYNESIITDETLKQLVECVEVKNEKFTGFL